MDNPELVKLVNKQALTGVILLEALSIRDVTKSSQTLYIWDITEDSYNYVICDTADNIPEVVTQPSITTNFIYKEPL